MKISVFAFSRKGCGCAENVSALFEGEDICLFCTERLAQGGFRAIPKPSVEFYRERFEESDALIFISSCGIAVREIAPFLSSKLSDPAVLVIDELGTYVIPLLSGHIGGANALAKRLAGGLRALPVITTATDLNGRFSVDTWASERGYALSDMKLAKEVSAAVLEGEVPFVSEIPVSGEIPAGLVQSEAGAEGELGIYIGYKAKEPFKKTLRVIPKMLYLGIGCRKGTGAEAIEAAVSKVLRENNIDRRAIVAAASIDLKAGEEGLLAFCRESGLPLRFCSAEELNSVPGDFTESAFVLSVTGTDSVCERASMAEGGRLIVKKTAAGGVTVAIAEKCAEVSFG